jgi:hypothetical protein
VRWGAAASQAIKFGVAQMSQSTVIWIMPPVKDFVQQSQVEEKTFPRCPTLVTCPCVTAMQNMVFNTMTTAETLQYPQK